MLQRYQQIKSEVLHLNKHAFSQSFIFKKTCCLVFPGGSAGKKLPAMRETQGMPVQFLGQEDHREEEIATHSVFLPGKSHGQRSLAGFSPWGHNELDPTEHILW